ncbi:fructose-bisphosphate aldolase class II [Lacrimispora xylanisolvens]|uniref:Fructose-bisphosphate aldolase class II n=1 Tax=Lacrimispora xylanisolvens TaxID=384636 RepID=A0A2S6HQY6_9FIRM|nr:class II fructose-bisphosphate aldolase [Hungatella xylanolytica]PPK80029.1 fructose-bisphosphate aldolase class II [Hungatella xylanolytica]
MLTSMKTILDHAHKHHYAVMAMNSINMEMVRGAITAAQEAYSPMIIQFGCGQMKNHAHAEEMLPMIRELAERVSVPIALNLDHATDYQIIADCINRGFTNIMFDGSSLSYEDNIERTAVVVAMAHAVGCSVEGELGHVGMAVDSDDTNLDLYTNPHQAQDFVNRTGVDALAVAVGTAHGDYPKGKIPKLDFDRLKLLKETVDVPLVLHGGSGSGEENLKKAIECGINKVNVATDAFSAGKKAMMAALEREPDMDYMHMCMEAEKGIKEFVMHYMEILGSANRYKFLDAIATGNE